MEARRAAGIDEWSQICSESFVPLRARGDNRFRGSIAHLSFGDVGVSRVDSTPSIVYRHGPLIAAEPRDDVLISIHLTGDGSVDQAGRTARLVPGAAAIYEADRPYQLTFGSSMSELVLQVPRRRLRIREAAIRDATARLIDGRSPGLMILKHYLTGILAEGTSPAGFGDQIAETALDLLSATLRTFLFGTAAPTPGSGDTLLEGARVYMQRRFDNPGLDISIVAQRLGVSRRYLEVLFSRTGQTPAEYLRELRLAEARRLLTNPALAISAVAHRAGFGDINTFTRCFRRVEGRTPRDWRRDYLSARNAGP